MCGMCEVRGEVSRVGFVDMCGVVERCNEIESLWKL